MNMKNMPEDYKNGSYSKQNGMVISSQGKFEMLQSSIYPEAYNVPCEYFFIIQILLKPDDLNFDMLLKRIRLKIKDRTKNKTTGQLEEIDVDIVRPLPNRERNKGGRNEGIPVFRGGSEVRHNVLLYVENLGAKVTGTIEYAKYDEDSVPGTEIHSL